MTPLPRAYAARLALAAALPALVLVGGCSDDTEPEQTPEQVLADAKQKLDDTTGVRLELTTDELPSGIDGVLAATGVGTHAPAFDGDLTVLVNELTVEVPVVAVDGAVYAQLPFTKKFSPVDPADYGAPDPAALMDPESGISSWLADVEGLEKGDQTRQGERVLTVYTGTLPGPAVTAVIPSADESADFEVTFSVDEESVLGSVEVAGPFYGDAGDVDYSITLSDYGSDPDIRRP